MHSFARGKHIVLGVSGGIAAYKSVELLRGLIKAEADVRVIMTTNARHFIGPMTFEALSGRGVCTSLFDHSDDAAIRHIDWAEAADAVVIAPATANTVAKLANGIADDALSTFMLAVTAPRLICPSMNTHMFEHPATVRNLDRLTADGYTVMTPDEGQLACGTTGPGRLPEPVDILDRIQKLFVTKDLRDKRVLVTAGPTREYLDPVRFISNPSSGKMGYAIARAAEYRGAEVILVTGPVSLPNPLNVNVIHIQSAQEMFKEITERLPWADVLIKTAAVGDYRPQELEVHKIKKSDASMNLTLVRNPDILLEAGHRKTDQLLIGFAAETRDLEKNAVEKLKAKNLDLIVGNELNGPHSGFESDTNTVTLFYKDGSREALPAMPKEEVAHLLMDRIVSMFPPE